MAVRRAPCVIRPSQVPPYQPGNHVGTRNRRLIGPETVGATKVEVVLGEIEPGGGAVRHAHPGIEQVCFMLDGNARVECNCREEEIGPGEACVFPAGVPHRFTVVGVRRARVIIIYAPPYGEIAANIEVSGECTP